MPQALFKVALSLEPRPGGGAELVFPGMRDLNYRFILVKDGGEEAIVEVDDSKRALAAMAEQPGALRLTAVEAKELRQSYPAPRLKTRYRRADSADGAENAPGAYALDAAGQPLVVTLQTVRSGYYLIDVPVQVSLQVGDP